MPSKSEKFNVMADEWEVQAKQALPHLRAEFLKIAAQWREMARDADFVSRLQEQLQQQRLQEQQQEQQQEQMKRATRRPLFRRDNRSSANY